MFADVLNIKSMINRKLTDLIGGPEYLTIQLDITNACNLNCTHCYHSNHINKGALDLEGWKKVLNQYSDLNNKLNTKPSFVLCGGEPLVSKSFKPIVHEIKSKWADAPITVLTNGTLLNEKNISFLKENKIDLQISLDGPNADIHDLKRGRGNFEKSISGAKKALAAELKIHFLAILSEQSYPWISSFFDLAKELRIYSMNFTRLIPEGQGKKLVNQGDDRPLEGLDLKDAYLSIINHSKRTGVHTNTNKPLFCLIDDTLGTSAKFGFQGIVIDYKGNLKVSSRTNFILGNVLTEGLESLFLKHPLMKQFRKGNIQGCGQCEYFARCGGDRNVSFSANGDFLGFDHGCWKPEFQHLKGDLYENQKNPVVAANNSAN